MSYHIASSSSLSMEMRLSSFLFFAWWVTSFNIHEFFKQTLCSTNWFSHVLALSFFCNASTPNMWEVVDTRPSENMYKMVWGLIQCTWCAKMDYVTGEFELGKRFQKFHFEVLSTLAQLYYSKMQSYDLYLDMQTISLSVQFHSLTFDGIKYRPYLIYLKHSPEPKINI